MRPSSQPLTLSEIRRQLSSPIGPGELFQYLEQAVLERDLHRWPIGRDGAYWHTDPAVHTRAQIRELLQVQPRTSSELTRLLRVKLCGLPRAFWQSELSQMMKERAIFLQPKLGRASARYALHPPPVLPYLRGEIETQLRDLIAAGVTIQELQTAILELLGTGSSQSFDWPTAILREAEKLQPGLRAGEPVSLPQLRRQPALMGLSMRDFDQVVLSLCDAGRLTLTAVDYQGELPVEDRRSLVVDEKGMAYGAFRLKPSAFVTYA